MKILTISLASGEQYNYGRFEIDKFLRKNYEIDHLIIKKKQNKLVIFNVFKIFYKLFILQKKGKLYKFIQNKLDYITNFKIISKYNSELQHNINCNFSQLYENKKDDNIIFTFNINKYLSSLAKYQYDILVVLGGSYIFKENLDKFKYKFNLHLGFLPNYKGCRTIECALLKQDLSKVGFTIHNLTSKLDGGSILYRCSINCYSEKSISKIYTECFTKGFQKIIEIIKNIDRTDAFINRGGEMYDYYFFNSKKFKKLLEMGYFP